MINLVKSTATFTATLANSRLVIGGLYAAMDPIVLSDLESVDKIANGAETAQVFTVTITRAASTRYGLFLSQFVGPSLANNGASNLNVNIAYTSTSGGASGDEIVVALVALINNSQLLVTAAKTADTTFTITTSAGYPVLRVAEAPASANISIADTTPGVAAVGDGDDLILEGIPGAEAGKAYVEYRGKIRGKSGPLEPFRLFIESTHTLTTLDNIFTGAAIDGATTTTIQATAAEYVAKNDA